MGIEDAREIIKRIIEKKTEKAKKIIDVFEIYFGEENIDNDLQKRIQDKMNSMCFPEECNEANITDYTIENCVGMDFSIKIHWPKITVKNDNNNTMDIYDLFCVVYMSATSGKLYEIKFLKSTYTQKQFNVGYVHSHLRSFENINSRIEPSKYSRYANIYKEPGRFCFGYGPIRNTIARLQGTSSSIDENYYMLFCRELDICVKVESLAGGPYIRMSQVLYSLSEYQKYESYITSRDMTSLELDFMKHFLKNSDLSYRFDGNEFDINCSFNDFAVIATKEFIQFVNDNRNCISESDIKQMLCYVVRKDGKYFINTRESSADTAFIDWINSNDVEIIKFKEQSYPLRIIKDDVNKRERKMVLLNAKFVTYLWRLVFTMINSNIAINGREEYESTGASNGENSEVEHEKVSYGFIV